MLRRMGSSPISPTIIADKAAQNYAAFLIAVLPSLALKISDVKAALSPIKFGIDRFMSTLLMLSCSMVLRPDGDAVSLT